MGANVGGAMGGTIGATTDGENQQDKGEGVDATIHTTPVALLSPLPLTMATVFCAPRHGSLGNSPRQNVPLSVPVGSRLGGSAYVTCYRLCAD